MHNALLDIFVHANSLSTLAGKVGIHEFLGKSKIDNETLFQKEII